MGKTKATDVAYLVVRCHDAEYRPVAVCEYLEDADNMVGKYNQEMKDRNIETINFLVWTVPFYD